MFVRVTPGATRADAALRELETVSWCPACGDVQGEGTPGKPCRACGKKTKTAGPLWTGQMVHEPLVNAARKEADASGLQEAAEILGALPGVDSFPPWSFDIDRICSRLKVPTVSELAVYRQLLKSGHRAMRTPFEKTGLKTDASHREVERAVKAASSEAGRAEPRPAPA